MKPLPDLPLFAAVLLSAFFIGFIAVFGNERLDQAFILWRGGL